MATELVGQDLSGVDFDGVVEVLVEGVAAAQGKVDGAALNEHGGEVDRPLADLEDVGQASEADALEITGL